MGSGEEETWWGGLRREAAGRADTGLAREVSKGVPSSIINFLYVVHIILGFLY